MAKKKKKEKWLKFRHKVVTGLLRFTLGVYTRLKYGVKVKKFKEQEDRPYLVLFNHQTAFDQFFVGMAFKGPIYYLASEDIFSKGWVSSLIRWLVAPIPIKKQTTDIGAILNCIRVAREGGTIAVAPEGNRTYHGRTVYMSPSIVPLAKKLGLPIVLFRIEGGYGVHPRWSDVIRRGRMQARVVRVIEPAEYASMTDDQLLDALNQGLDWDDTTIGGEYYHKKSAEYLERVMYVCPDCGLSEWESCGDVITCRKCGQRVRYLPDLRLEGLDRPFPYTYVKDWYRYQEKFISELHPEDYIDHVVYEDEVSLSRVILYKHKEAIADDVTVRLWGDRMHLVGKGVDIALPFGEVSVMSVLGRNKLNIYIGQELYQLKGDKRFNAVKYMNFYYHYTNVQKGETNGEFLGL